jgi:P-type Ca2+ transporter type 2B
LFNRFGTNTKRIPKIRSLWEIILEALGDNILIMLCILATVNVVIGVYQEGWGHGWVDGVAIYAAVVIIVSIAAGNNYSKEKQFQKLVAKASIEYCAVFRGGEGMTQTIAVSELVVGDVIKIEQGMRIPADAILLEGIDVSTDEAAMTGEPDQMEKSTVTQENYEHNPDPFLLGKTLICQGQGTAMICCVGVNSRSGMAEEKLQTEEDQTPLQQKLEGIANSLAKFGALFAVFAFLLGCGRIVITNLLSDRPVSEVWAVSETINSFLKALITGVTVVIIAVPEGLPLAVTISFAFSVMKMKDENNLVRKLASSETMGGANEVCTDKTGTLTKNQMTVKEFYTMDTVFQGRPSNFKELATADLMGEGVLYNCSARIERNDRGEQEPKGNVTEQGLLRCLMDLQVPCMETLLAKDQYTLHLIPFNSSRKRAATCIRHPKNPNLVRAFCKGAPEIVLTYVNKMFDKNGKVVPIDEAQKEHIKRKIVGDTFAVKAYRTLLIAYADYTYDEYLRLKDANNNFAGEADREALEQGLTLIGIYALQDPLRDEVISSVRICHRAGINIRMVTGDNIDTAKAIALEAGILKAEHKDRKYAVMEGKQFRELCGGLRKVDTGSDLLREEIVNKEIFKEIAASL